MAKKKNYNENILIALSAILCPLLFTGMLIFRSNKNGRVLGLIAFCILYGVTFPFSNYKLDSARYAGRLGYYENFGLTDFFLYLKGNYLVNENLLDLFTEIITYAVSSVGGNRAFLFSVFALLYCFVQRNVVRRILSGVNTNISGKSKLLFFVLLFCVIPVFYINGFRFYFATWVFVLFGLRFVESPSVLRYLYLFTVPAIHFTYLGPAIVSIYCFFKASLNKYAVFTMLIVSMVVGNYALYFLGDIFSSGNYSIFDKSARYTNENYVEFVRENSESRNIIEYLGGPIFTYYLVFIYVLLCIFRVRYFGHIWLNVRRLWFYVGVLAAFYLVGKSIPSFARFGYIFELFFIVLLIKLSLYSNRNNQVQKFLKMIFFIGAPFLILRLIVISRLAIEVTGIHLLLPIFAWPYFENDSLYSYFLQ